MKKTISAMVLVLASQAPAFAAVWGAFRDDGCKDVGNGVKVRVYKSILWDIPWGADWEIACANTPATLDGVYFPRPTTCEKSSILQPLAVIASVLGTIAFVGGTGGLGLLPATAGYYGLASGLTGSTSLILAGSGAGALNMWGGFYVLGKCGNPPESTFKLGTGPEIYYSNGQGHYCQYENPTELWRMTRGNPNIKDWYGRINDYKMSFDGYCKG
jgi:hypothetical protein